MMANTLRCRWVRRRLALLAGDPEGRDVRWDDRRHVERHLIGCPMCRAERVSLGSAVAVLHGAAAEIPAKSDAPSVWPALDRQIRASRHERPNAWSGLHFGPSLGLAAGLLVAGTAVGLVGGRLHRPRPVAPASRPDDQADAPKVPAPRPALPEGPADAKLAAEPQVAPRPDVRLDLDPKTGANRDPQRAVGQ
jgi:anti-sigma factor RsiW